jgi:hypothetical protein
MDNGLIFPYPPARAKAKPTDTNHVTFAAGPSGLVVGGTWDLGWGRLVMG